jgi:sugar phosphate isomerase/epimerase
MPRIGVCSWSLQPPSASDLASLVRETGLAAVQLALDPIRTGAWDEASTVDALRAGGISILSGMIGAKGEDYSTLDTIRRTGGLRPDEHWKANLAAAQASAAVAQRLQIGLVTFHAGFLPHHPGDPERRVMLDRLRTVARVFAERGVSVALETGQESSETLVGVLEDLADAAVGVNFDPANIILYGMGEPAAALVRLSPWVRQVHIKDATPTPIPGTWGTEQVVGRGAVQWPEVFRVLREKCPEANLVVEREAGEQRVQDVKTAVEVLRQFVG